MIMTPNTSRLLEEWPYHLDVVDGVRDGTAVLLDSSSQRHRTQQGSTRRDLYHLRTLELGYQLDRNLDPSLWFTSDVPWLSIRASNSPKEALGSHIRRSADGPRTSSIVSISGPIRDLTFDVVLDGDEDHWWTEAFPVHEALEVRTEQAPIFATIGGNGLLIPSSIALCVSTNLLPYAEGRTTWLHHKV